MGSKCSCVAQLSPKSHEIDSLNNRKTLPNWEIDSDESIILDPVEVQVKSLIRLYLCLKTFRAIPLFQSFLNPGKVVFSSPKIPESLLKTELTLSPFPEKRIKGPTIENFPTVLLENNESYSGQWDISQQRPEGWGIFIESNKSKYDGQFKSGKKSGIGRLINSEGEVYEGEFFIDKKQGHGKLRKVDGSYYVGGFLNNLEHGEGKLYHMGKVIYSGGFIRGHKHGKGTLHIGLNVYKGDFFADQIDGQGLYQWSDGKSYDGFWKNNKMHGFGTYKWPDGKSYTGHFVEGLKEGVGTFKWNDGREYHGGWAEGKMHGEGAYTYFDKGKKRNFVAIYELGKRKKVLRY
jgi:hypothetical protein